MDPAKKIIYTLTSQLRATYDPTQRSLCLHWNPRPRPCYNMQLLGDLLNCCQLLRLRGNILPETYGSCPVEYVILSSDTPGVFMLGGDLNHFVTAIENRDRDALLTYGRACVDLLYSNFNNFGRNLTNISLVKGECLGGGFEGALASDLIIAEKQARFGFPEIRFNLFPGMGALQLLTHRIGHAAATRIIAEGATFSAEEMHAMGIVDIVVDQNEGDAEIARLIRQRQLCHNGLEALTRSKRRMLRLDYAELLDIVEIWSDAALRLTSRDLKMIRRLVARQSEMYPTDRFDD